MRTRLALLLPLLVLAGCTAEPPPLSGREVEPEGVELADVMLKMQVHANKLWFAGTAGNRDLARFYADELDEDYAPLLGRDVLEGSTNVSEVMESVMPPAVEAIRQAVLDGDAARFERAYDQMLNACNACHRATGHGFVVLVRPERPVFDSQRYAPGS